MWISFRKTQQSQAPRLISIGNEVLGRAEVFKVLGVHVQRDLFGMHISMIL